MPSINSLVAPSIRTWVGSVASPGETYTPRKQNADDSELKRGIVDLNSAIADVENNYAGASEPNYKPRGKTYYDTSAGVQKVYHQTNGTPVAILDVSKAYAQSLSTAGTATFKLGGAINKNTTQVSGFTLMSYTLPGNSLNSDAKVIESICFGTSDGPEAANLKTRFGATVIASHGLSLTPSDWFIKFDIIRTGAVEQDCGSLMKLNRDDDGSITLCEISTTTKTLSDDNAIDIIWDGAFTTKSETIMTNIIL